ncbi:MAG: beta-ketoacyl synthase N-terminal-like domain-containing protein, partial [Kangiellaceae bacterium]|nr:beta-ketoacyl synthase N-terminal-like domain-containing protein [Kangiellaceae bacterium]
PKVNGSICLDQSTKHIDLDFFVFFSSITSSIGYIGQSDYATANGFLDQFAHYRNQLVSLGERKGKTLAFNWQYWEQGGIRLDENGLKVLQSEIGIKPLSTELGMQAFYSGLNLNSDQVLVMNGNLAQIEDALLGKVKGNQFVQRKALNNEASLDGVTASKKQDVKEITIAANSSLQGKTQNYLCKQFASQLKIPVSQINPLAPLENYGIDSILAMNLTGHLEKTFGTLSKTLFFEYKTINELTEYFCEAFADKLVDIFDDTPQPIPVPENLTTDENATVKPDTPVFGNRFQFKNSNDGGNSKAYLSSISQPIAIIGLSGRYPESTNIDNYWTNLKNGNDCIIEVPKERWDWQEYYNQDRTTQGNHFSKWGGFIEGVDEFDARFFNISPREAVTIDPQERLFLQHAWMAIEDAGYTRDSLQIAEQNDLAGQVGVYAGVMYSEYQLLGAEASLQGDRMGIASSVASIANRVSYVLNIHGPSMTLDTMCSSSLTSIHLACQDLKLGRTSMAIAGGVNVSIHPNKYLMLSTGQFISSDGHCQSFGEGGDGYIPGEGVGVVVLKRLAEAERDGDPIYGLIQGSSLNHGGKTNGYTVPNPQAQASAITRALNESNINPRHISYIEAHGTGTKLGDPIEIAALSKAFNQHTEDKAFCLIGSAKSNIGHCESAAGIAGLTKVLLQMKYRQIVPSLHSAQLNPHIDFPNTPFVVNQRLTEWQRPTVEGQEQPLIAGVSSFGAGGSNAHVIVQEYAPRNRMLATQLQEQVIVPLSAHTIEQLNQKVTDLVAYLETSPTDTTSQPNLSSLAYTLQVGREAMPERLSFVVDSVEQLVEKLQRYLQGELDFDDAFQGQVKKHQDGIDVIAQDDDMVEAIDKWIARKKLSKLAELWVKGLTFEWRKLYAETLPQRISLP